MSRCAQTIMTTVLVVCCIGMPTPGLAAPPLTAAQQRIVERIARAAARTQVIADIRDLPLGRGASVGQWIDRNPDLDRALRLWARDLPAHGHPRIYSDGVCEVDVRVLPDAIVSKCREWLDAYPSTANKIDLTRRRLDSAAQSWPWIWATGRATLPRQRRASHPEGWESVSPAGVDRARDAAIRDALAALRSEVGRLTLGDGRRLDDFLNTSDAIGHAVQIGLERAADVQVEYEADQVAVATARVDVVDLVRLLTRAHEEHYSGSAIQVADFRAMATRVGRGMISGTGLATAPADATAQSQYAPIEYNAPKWAGNTIEAAGRFVSPAATEVTGTLRIEAARLDAIDNLRRQIMSLAIQQDVTVAQFAAIHGELKPDIVLFLSGARIVGRPRLLGDGITEVRVELPMHRLWEIVRRKMALEEVEPPQSSDSTNPTRKTEHA